MVVYGSFSDEIFHSKARFEPIFKTSSQIDREFPFLEKWGHNVKFCLREPQKAYSCADVFWRIDPQNRCSGFGVASWKNPKTSPMNIWLSTSHMWGQSRLIGSKCNFAQFCTRVDIRDVVTSANFGNHRVIRFRMAVFPLIFNVVLTTLWYYRSTVWRYSTSINSWVNWIITPNENSWSMSSCLAPVWYYLTVFNALMGRVEMSTGYTWPSRSNLHF